MNIEPAERDRLRRAFCMRSTEAKPTNDCPPSEEIWNAVHGELGTRSTASIVEHTSVCATCAESWRFAATSCAALPDAAASAAIRPSRWLGWVLNHPARTAMVAAMLLLAVLVPWNPREIPDPDPPIFRAQPTNSIETLLPESVALRRDDCRLRWSPGPPGTVFDLRVSTEDLRILVSETGLEQHEYVMEPELLEPLASGSKLVWQVVAYLPDGATATGTFLTPIE